MVRRGMFEDQPDCQASVGSHLSEFILSLRLVCLDFLFCPRVPRELITGYSCVDWNGTE